MPHEVQRWQEITGEGSQCQPEPSISEAKERALWLMNEIPMCHKMYGKGPEAIGNKLGGQATKYGTVTNCASLLSRFCVYLMIQDAYFTPVHRYLDSGLNV